MLIPFYQSPSRAPAPGHRKTTGVGVFHATVNDRLVTEVRRRKQQIADFVGEEVRAVR